MRAGPTRASSCWQQVRPGRDIGGTTVVEDPTSVIQVTAPTEEARHAGLGEAEVHQRQARRVREELVAAPQFAIIDDLVTRLGQRLAQRAHELGGVDRNPLNRSKNRRVEFRVVR